jgi:hypothetical protein
MQLKGLTGGDKLEATLNLGGTEGTLELTVVDHHEKDEYEQDDKVNVAYDGTKVGIIREQAMSEEGVEYAFIATQPSWKNGDVIEVNKSA